MQYTGLPPQPGSSQYTAHHGSLPPQPLPNPHDRHYPPGPAHQFPPLNHIHQGYHQQPLPPMSNGYHNQHTHVTYPQQPYHHAASPPDGHAAYAQPIRGVEAVPSPTPKVAYEAPVFQTFQERRRAKEMALRAQMGEPSSSSFSQVPIHAPSPVSYPQQHQHPIPSHRSPSPANPPPPSTMVMMGQPTSGYGSAPVPPSRSRSPAPAPSPISAPSVPSYRQPPSNAQSRPLPSPRALPSFPSTPGSTPSHSGTSSPYTSQGSSMPPPPIATASPIQANLERSDTRSSVKSLDRTGFSSSPVKRSLPKPPVGVNSSKSLDRGIPTTAGGSTGVVDGFKRTMNRNQPSVVEESPENSLVDGILGISISQRSSPAPAIPSIRTSSPAPSPPVIVTAGSSLDTRTPAKFSPLPAINVPDSDTSSVMTTDDECESRDLSQVTPKAKRNSNGPSSPGIQFSGLPVISVSTSDTADESPSSNGEISFAVPNINFDNGSPSISINVPSVSAPVAAASSSRPVRSRVQVDGSAIICAGCNNAIIGRIVNAMGQRWHPQCFGCAECGELLEHVSSYEWEGKAYCHLDFHDKFAHRCHHCQTPIVDPRFVTLNDPVLGQRYYHELHFFCSECGDPFLDPSKSSAPGTEKSRPDNGENDEEEDNETSAFVIQKGHPYCEKCHLRLHKPKCKACNLPIPDLAINAMGAKWHKECFVCSQCHNEFANNLFFPKDGQAFCTSCYEDIIAST